ncbi:helix-turn-helix domain-containing protein [Parapedobacter koreensis]|uniref:AraC-type DNA-binding protein n=1 Tax=Parapedobacter koreensis TaxID=332977 RepID=A0A1H7LP58_9SPHI|nr:response regulator transcription factor [Parapedobacter koreensis]SEL00518.1 AraC-type DNA-binding protein [Parapedobacter koreensis]
MEKRHIKTIYQCHAELGIAKPKHPLFSILKFEELPTVKLETKTKLIFDYYQIVFKRNCSNKLIYGQTSYDFDEGVMSYFSPRQISIAEPGVLLPESGWTINLSPDFLSGYPLGSKISRYGFFDYAVHEALILSEEEELVMENILQQIWTEYHLPIDQFSQDVVVSNLELLLTYSNRYYNRQFVVRKPTNDTLLSKFEQLLTNYIEHEIGEKGLPSVHYFANELNLSDKYFSDLLKQHTGLPAQQHIHEKLIAKAKVLLSTTDLTVSEIAYELGFEYSQSFSNLFKSKTKQTPLAFRAGFKLVGEPLRKLS